MGMNNVRQTHDTKEIIRVLGFIQEYFDNHAYEQEPDCRKELFLDWSEITMDAITLLKAQAMLISERSSSEPLRTAIGPCLVLRLLVLTLRISLLSLQTKRRREINKNVSYIQA